ncbi:hypothetical protein F2P81_004892 [Scophthalmus maximus]|uniref:Uncharacterized protein n=1 Tax=Scophthalmus maximus TaxID=52904 RepID=A0A6A4TED3_SCOMX|nr:hypothetical protein F2P81_004892 [Scophthalmus maximus]
MDEVEPANRNSSAVKRKRGSGDWTEHVLLCGSCIADAPRHCPCSFPFPYFISLARSVRRHLRLSSPSEERRCLSAGFSDYRLQGTDIAERDVRHIAGQCNVMAFLCPFCVPVACHIVSIKSKIIGLDQEQLNNINRKHNMDKCEWENILPLTSCRSAPTVLNTLSSPVPLLLMMDAKASKSKGVIGVSVDAGQEGAGE